jgi:hypothetical protein
MIVGHKTGDVIHGPERHVAFAVNSEGYNDAGLAGNVAFNYWPELAETGPIRMGEMLSKDTGSKVFHAMVVHSLEEGWEETPKHIEACFNALQVATDEEVASIAMGAGMIGMMSGANPDENLAAMDRSNKSIVIYNFA